MSSRESEGWVESRIEVLCLMYLDGVLQLIPPPSICRAMASMSIELSRQSLDLGRRVGAMCIASSRALISYKYLSSSRMRKEGQYWLSPQCMPISIQMAAAAMR